MAPEHCDHLGRWTINIKRVPPNLRHPLTFMEIKLPATKSIYRDPKWFAKNLKRMTAIANEAPRADFYSRIRRELPSQCALPLKKGKLQSVYGILKSELSLLSWEAMTQGAIAILNDDPTGWKEMRLGFIYDSWAARLRHSFITYDNCYDEANNPASAALFEGKEALTLCHAIATKDDDYAHGFGRHLVENFERTHGGSTNYFYSMPLFPFVLKLYCMWIGKDLSFRQDVVNPLGRYQQVFDHWDQPIVLRDSLLDICDLHCEEAVDGKGAPAFAFHPYNLFPVEIMSIMRIRSLLGLETPQISHPLVQSQLLQPPEVIPYGDAAVMENVIARFRKDFPDGSNCW